VPGTPETLFFKVFSWTYSKAAGKSPRRFFSGATRVLRRRRFGPAATIGPVFVLEGVGTPDSVAASLVRARDACGHGFGALKRRGARRYSP